ncbi:Cupredoxin domain-containing protein [Strongyloides ratti]|uniref:Cupredoxin domain-containing protein n=1 Tax=Strongyloides ratti TaxID=34506 RepID=A0A090LN91_STRRB|nr:Cupredoxin domain-containing protein [Strongyloides ratti]CEF71325.1 Cupredoxin domain-containing protein [Strongyloides ratti]
MKILYQIFSYIFLFPLLTISVKIHNLPLKFKDGILTDISRLVMKVGDKLEVHCPEKMHFTLYKVSSSMGEACVIPAHSTQIVAICKPGITGKIIIRSSTVGRMMKATFTEGEDGYIISVNSGLDEKIKANSDENQYGGLCLKSNLKIPFSIVTEEVPKEDIINVDENINTKIENFINNPVTRLPGSRINVPSEERNPIVPRQSSGRIPSDRFKYSSINEDGKFTNANKEAKVERYMVDKVKLYLDVKAAIDNNPNLKSKTKVAFSKVENYFRGLIQFTEKEIRDLIELFELHQDSDYDIGYEELTRDSSGSGTTIIIVSLLAAFMFLTGLTIIVIIKHLK